MGRGGEPGPRARRLAIVPGQHVCPHRGQRTRRRQAVAAEADNGEVRAGEQRGGKAGHRIFKVASPTSARMNEMIQNRITMVGSAQPFFSK